SIKSSSLSACSALAAERFRRRLFTSTVGEGSRSTTLPTSYPWRAIAPRTHRCLDLAAALLALSLLSPGG
ncbi:hypothetical protein, partial [Klebsiella aerogenes]|uniref:hypothetical protein n=1 Tax=Klebsiella aerogenes TaxID=548 RepID=UPI0019540BBB